jgi:hypothetical protein
LRAYAEAGVEHLSLNPAADDDDLLEQVRRLRAVVTAAEL